MSALGLSLSVRGGFIDQHVHYVLNWSHMVSRNDWDVQTVFRRGFRRIQLIHSVVLLISPNPRNPHRQLLIQRLLFLL